RLWRDRHTLQLGLDPARAVLLEIANPAAARLLDLLDGGHSERAILDHAARIRVGRPDARSLLDALRTAGLVVAAHTLLPRELTGPARTRLAGEAAAIALRAPEHPGTPAQLLRRRRAARVVVTGYGRLGGPLAVTLAQAGVGHVDPALDGRVDAVDIAAGWLVSGDEGRPRSVAVAEAVHRTVPETRTAPVSLRHATLVVQGGSDRPAALLAAGYARRRQPHLLVGLRDGVPVIGPLVRPPAGPCLNCLDLHRRDRDPAWPALAAQLAGETAGEPCATATLLAAVAYATSEVLTVLDGGTPETVGGAVEISSPGRLRRRVWPPHPGCDCGARRPVGREVAPATLSLAAPQPESRSQ
ncbi:TOMM precursor leader peptide-binding protein, partial [Micromonospora echinofusca]